MARLPNFLVIIRSEKLSGKGQGRGAKKRTFRFGKKNVSFPKVETFRFADYTWGERTIQVDCSFLPQDKKYTIEIFQDKKRSNKNANLYEHKIMDMDNKNIIEMFMASGGGFVMVIREK